MITLSPMRQSWAMCVPIMNRQLSPTEVIIPPPWVPGFMVTYSRMTLLRPMVSFRGFAFVFHILGRMPDGGEGINARSLADRGSSRDHHMGNKTRAVPQGYFGANVTIGSDDHARAEPGSGLDDRGRMDRVQVICPGSWRCIWLRPPPYPRPWPRRRTARHCRGCAAGPRGPGACRPEPRACENARFRST
jgi:hypothetical protein